MFSLGKGGATSTTKVSILMAIWNGFKSKVGNKKREDGKQNGNEKLQEISQRKQQGSSYWEPIAFVNAEREPCCLLTHRPRTRIGKLHNRYDPCL
jgi:hypothetical protein